MRGDTQVVIRDEDLRGVENARLVLGKLIDADIEIHDPGIPLIPLVVGDLEGLLAKIRAQQAEQPGDIGAELAELYQPSRNVRVLELSGGRVLEPEPGEGGGLRG